jgi:hypothetical protein
MKFVKKKKTNKYNTHFRKYTISCAREDMGNSKESQSVLTMENYKNVHNAHSQCSVTQIP